MYGILHFCRLPFSIVHGLSWRATMNLENDFLCSRTLLEVDHEPVSSPVGVLGPELRAENYLSLAPTSIGDLFVKDHLSGEEFFLDPAGKVARGQPLFGQCHYPPAYAFFGLTFQNTVRRGDFFEVVLSQVFSIGCDAKPSEIFDTIRRRNPSPYDFLINLGDEQLIGGSPEMFVRVKGDQVETCPISGTGRRGTGPRRCGHRSDASRARTRRQRRPSRPSRPRPCGRCTPPAPRKPRRSPRSRPAMRARSASDNNSRTATAPPVRPLA
ncbi:MAG: chorismate-binding protein [Planctomycetes bacterium]|nr:chorismate-binding protein [Planctomycetota bacterium]